MKQALKDAGVKILAPQEVVFATQGGAATLVDVRPAHLYEAGCIEGAVNAPYYRPIEGWSPWQIARRVGYAAFGVFKGTEVNPEFGDLVAQAVGGDLGRPLVLYCSQGGSLEATAGQGRQGRGFQTRSLIAAYELVQRGHTAVSVLKGGFFEWAAAERPIVEPGSGAACEPEPSEAQGVQQS
ncbi:MAG: Rhodanese-like protein [Monoraphidium minutum]|nr:MAG: Rhodanese-like protein [Monoraphidium minutum]